MSKIEKWQEGLTPLFIMALVLITGGVVGGIFTGLGTLALEVLNIGDPQKMDGLIEVGGAIGAIVLGPMFYADHMKAEAQPKLIDNLSEPMVLALLPLERLWQRRADLLRDLAATDGALAGRINVLIAHLQIASTEVDDAAQHDLKGLTLLNDEHVFNDLGMVGDELSHLAGNLLKREVFPQRLARQPIESMMKLAPSFGLPA